MPPVVSRSPFGVTSCRAHVLLEYFGGEGTPLPGGFRAAYCRLGTKPARSEVNFLGCWHYVPHLAEGTPLPGGFRAAYYRFSMVLLFFCHFGCFGRSRDP